MVEPPAVTIYHNPACGTSRNTLTLLRAAGADLQVIEYLATPPGRDVITELAERIGLPLREIMRKKGTPYTELGLDDQAIAEVTLLDAIETHPILLNRPIVVSQSGTKLCRPSDVVLDLLPKVPAERVLKEEGVPFLRDIEISPDDRGFCSAIAAAGLPIDDLAEPNRTFFAYSTLDGERVGYGGLERHGDHVLVRSVLVIPGARNVGLGSNIVPILLFRAFEAGARQAFLLTTSTAPFFAKLGFKDVDRANVPPQILSTRQAADLCPASAHLMTRKLGF